MRADLDQRSADRPERMSIEPMTSADIRTVMRIEALSFTTSWPTSAFASELNDNKLAHYFVGRVPGGDIVAYGGIWVIVDDSHITTIAVHPDWRGKKYGEEMLVHLLHEATDRGGVVDHARGARIERRRAESLPEIRLHDGVDAPRILQRQRRKRGRDVGRQSARRSLSQSARHARARLRTALGDDGRR